MFRGPNRSKHFSSIFEFYSQKESLHQVEKLISSHSDVAFFFVSTFFTCILSGRIFCIELYFCLQGSS